MSVVSGAQFGSQANRAGPVVSDDPDSLGDPLGGWKGGATPSSLMHSNITTPGKVMSWRPEGLSSWNSQTGGTFLDFSKPSWQDRYKSQ